MKAVHVLASWLAMAAIAADAVSATYVAKLPGRFQGESQSFADIMRQVGAGRRVLESEPCTDR